MLKFEKKGDKEGEEREEVGGGGEKGVLACR